MFQYSKKSIGKRIQTVRKAKKMTLKDFSEILEVPISSISSWERGVNVPNRQNLQLLSETTGVDENWLLYGEIADYLQDIFDYYELNEVVNEEKFFELEKVLQEMNYKPGNFKLLKETAELVIPNFTEYINYDEDAEVLSTHMLNNEFPILQDRQFQTTFLPMLQYLLTEEEKDINSKIILFVLDLLARMNQKTKSNTKIVFRDINWLLSNNIFRLERKFQSNEPKYGGIPSEAYDKQMERNFKEIQSDTNRLIEEISIRLKDIVEMNYEEFLKRDYKTIF